jgi:hypothetical protein
MGLRTKVCLTTDIIVALGVLHNLALKWNEPEPEDGQDEDGPEEDDEEERENFLTVGAAATRAIGQTHRNWLADNFC